MRKALRAFGIIVLTSVVLITAILSVSYIHRHQNSSFTEPVKTQTQFKPNEGIRTKGMRWIQNISPECQKKCPLTMNCQDWISCAYQNHELCNATSVAFFCGDYKTMMEIQTVYKYFPERYGMVAVSVLGVLVCLVILLCHCSLYYLYISNRNTENKEKVPVKQIGPNAGKLKPNFYANYTTVVEIKKEKQSSDKFQKEIV